MRELYRSLKEYNDLLYTLPFSCVFRKFRFATKRFAIIISVPLLNMQVDVVTLAYVSSLKFCACALHVVDAYCMFPLLVPSLLAIGYKAVELNRFVTNCSICI